MTDTKSDRLARRLVEVFPGLRDGSEVAGADLVDWLTQWYASQDESAAQALRVLVTVHGGVADYVSDDGVDVVIFDRDSYDAGDPGKVPAHFIDLATSIHVPLSGKRDPDLLEPGRGGFSVMVYAESNDTSTPRHLGTVIVQALNVKAAETKALKYLWDAQLDAAGYRPRCAVRREPVCE